MQNSEHDDTYINVTETPDTKGSQEQISRLYSRYRFAIDYCLDKDVIEVACGAGLGLGYLARYAKKVVGGDIDENNLQFARNTYSGRSNIEVITLDAHKLPFRDNSFDVVILYEAIYYLPQPALFLREAFRILRDKGVIIICSANKDWDEFNPSPFSYKYYSVPELYSLLVSNHFEAELYGECPATDDTIKGKIIGAIKMGAVKLRLMPTTMKGKELLKRVFFGKLVTLPSEITEGLSAYIPPMTTSHDKSNSDYKVIFAVGRKV